MCAHSITLGRDLDVPLSLPMLKAILESEPFSISIEDADDAKRLGEEFAMVLGKNARDAYTHVLAVLSMKVTLPAHCCLFQAVLRMTHLV